MVTVMGIWTSLVYHLWCDLYSSFSRRRRRENNSSDTHLYDKPVKYKTSKNKETVNEEQTHQNNLPSSDERDENPNVFTVNKTIIDEFQLTLHFSRRWSTSCRPGKKWDLGILDPGEHLP